MNSEKVYYDYRESTATTQEQSSDTDGLDKEISIATFPSLVRKRSYSLDGATGLDLNTVITYGNPKGNASKMLSTTNLPSNVAIGVGESKNNHTNVSAPSFGSVLGNSGSDSNNSSHPSGGPELQSTIADLETEFTELQSQYSTLINDIVQEDDIRNGNSGSGSSKDLASSCPTTMKSRMDLINVLQRMQGNGEQLRQLQSPK